MRAAETLRAALDLWDGEPLSGLPGPWAQSHRPHLAEQRLWNDSAITAFTSCLADFRRIGQRLWEHHTLFRLAESHLSAGDKGRATACAEESLHLSRGNDHRFGQGRALMVLGRALAEIGATDRARGCWEQALEILHELGAPAEADVRALLDDELIRR